METAASSEIRKTCSWARAFPPCKSARFDNKGKKAIVTLVAEKLAYAKDTATFKLPVLLQKKRFEQVSIAKNGFNFD